MMWLYSFNFLVVVVFAIFFYRAGEWEGSSGIIWAAASVVISIAVWRWLRWDWPGMILGQIALFAAIGVFRTLREDRK